MSETLEEKKRRARVYKDLLYVPYILSGAPQHLYKKFLKSLKGYETYERLHSKYWTKKFKKRTDHEVMKDLALCLSVEMDPYLMGLLVVVMCHENDTMYERKREICAKDLAIEDLVKH